VEDEVFDLRPAQLALDSLLLDPNNPRLVRLGEDAVERYTDCQALDPGLQEEVAGDIRDDAVAGIQDLVNKIRRRGFLTIDRIVVRPVRCDGDASEEYVVLEGNRRVAALKYIRSNAGMMVDLSDEVKNTFDPIEVLVYHGDDEDVAWEIQGLRHIESIKQWGLYQQAKYVHDMLDSRGMTAADLHDATGYRVADINRLYRSFLGFQQARTDTDYGPELEEGDFSVFHEAVFAKPALRDWLGWRSDRFEHVQNLSTLMKLVKEKINGVARITRVNPDLRDRFTKLLSAEYTEIRDEFLDDQLDLSAAYAKALQKDAQRETHERGVDLDARRRFLVTTNEEVRTLPIPDIAATRELAAEFVDLLAAIRDSCERQVSIVEAATRDDADTREAG
jgi:hypothetical protein